MPNEDPNRVVLARRKAGYGSVSWAPSGDYTTPDEFKGVIEPGDCIPMRWQEANDREDFEFAGELTTTPAKAPKE